MLDRDALETLLEKASVAIDALCAADGRPVPAPLDDDLGRAAAALVDLEPEGGDRFLTINTGSYGAVTEGTLTVSGGDELGRRVAQVNDVVDQLLALGALLGVVPDGSFARLHGAAVFMEMAALFDLILGPPSGAPKDFDSLLSLIANDRRSYGRAVLKELEAAVSMQLREETRQCRNGFAAHIDPALPFRELINWLDQVDAAGVCQSATHIVDEFLDAAGSDPLLSLLVLGPAVSSSFVRDQADPSPAPWAAEAPRGVSQDPALPANLDSRFVAYVHGPVGSVASAAVAGMVAARAERIRRRQLERAESEPTSKHEDAA